MPELTPDEERDYERDIAELGVRVVYWLDREQLGAAYARLEDRAWAVVTGCVAKCAASLGSVPPEWVPRFDGKGLWHMPGEAPGSGLGHRREGAGA